ncbi:hypothetical protein FQN54_006709 [Arachnomyces sp. PD_36]|nr:hypothetical protein FQN54_006709 [Arachnomyces sp. PD_36]
MSKTNGIQIYLGSIAIGDQKDPLCHFNTPEAAREYTNLFHTRGYDRIDTARIYPTEAPGTTEQILGQIDAATDFVIDSKILSFFSGAHKAGNIQKSVDESLATLKTSKVNVMYLHSPDRDTPFEESCEAMNKAYEAGKFKYFGISNYTAGEVEQIMNICTSHGWVTPVVYQGHYNALIRSTEQLITVLRKHRIQFVAYSPAAGGFFSGLEYGRPGSRFRTETVVGQFYCNAYGKDGLKERAAMVVAKAEAEGMTGHAAALRWIIHHSQLQEGDGVVLGASTLAQLTNSIDAVEAGPLPQSLVEMFDELWETVKGSMDPYHH